MPIGSRGFVVLMVVSDSLAGGAIFAPRGLPPGDGTALSTTDVQNPTLCILKWSQSEKRLLLIYLIIYVTIIGISNAGCSAVPLMVPRHPFSWLVQNSL